MFLWNDLLYTGCQQNGNTWNLSTGIVENYWINMLNEEIAIMKVEGATECWGKTERKYFAKHLIVHYWKKSVKNAENWSKITKKYRKIIENWV